MCNFSAVLVASHMTGLLLKLTACRDILTMKKTADPFLNSLAPHQPTIFQHPFRNNYDKPLTPTASRLSFLHVSVEKHKNN